MGKKAASLWVKRVRARDGGGGTAIKVPPYEGHKKKECPQSTTGVNAIGTSTAGETLLLPVMARLRYKSPEGTEALSGEGKRTRRSRCRDAAGLTHCIRAAAAGHTENRLTRQGASLPSDRNRARAEREAARSPRPIP